MITGGGDEVTVRWHCSYEAGRDYVACTYDLITKREAAMMKQILPILDIYKNHADAID